MLVENKIAKMFSGTDSQSFSSKQFTTMPGQLRPLKILIVLFHEFHLFNFRAIFFSRVLSFAIFLKSRKS